MVSFWRIGVCAFPDPYRDTTGAHMRGNYAHLPSTSTFGICVDISSTFPPHFLRIRLLLISCSSSNPTFYSWRTYRSLRVPEVPTWVATTAPLAHNELGFLTCNFSLAQKKSCPSLLPATEGYFALHALFFRCRTRARRMNPVNRRRFSPEYLYRVNCPTITSVPD